MSSKSSYLPRLGFSRGDGPILPLHNRTSPPIRKKHSEYSLSELSPRPDDGLLSSSPENDRDAAVSSQRGSSPSARYHDWATDKASSKTRAEPPPLFTGPPPPIATSQMLYRDEEERDASSTSSRHFGATSLARNIGSVLFDRNTPSPNRTRNRDYDPKPDAIWRNLQRRERALQKELQHLLDAQSAGLAANLGSDDGAPGVSNASSDSGARSIAPTTSPTPITAHTAGSSQRSQPRHVTFEDRRHRRHHHHDAATSTSSVTSSGTLVPVRQPRPKSVGLRAARAGLARSIALLADLKAEEDAQLAAALSARKKALAQLRRWTARREGIAEELRLLEADHDEGAPGRELQELEGERDAVAGEIAELEERLASLKRRRARLDERLEAVRSRREAGLSGYRGALREVEGKIGELLIRPGVRPLDGEFFSSPASDHEGGRGIRESPGGVEFLQLRPERRTAEMAREWWENEVAILEKKKKEVDKERTALEQGVEVWRGAVMLVSEFEAELRNQLRESGNAEGGSGNGKGKNREGDQATPPSPEQTMLAQLDRMQGVMAGLEERLRVAEQNGWNLLICAIGAELEAFRQADSMLREALRSAGVNVGDDDGTHGDSTPRLGKSTGLENSGQGVDRAEMSGEGKLVDLHDGDSKQDRDPESDNEVPPDLLVSALEDAEPESPGLSRKNSNEIPAEFLREHHDDEGFPGFGAMT